jgi:hypothetical protein
MTRIMLSLLGLSMCVACTFNDKSLGQLLSDTALCPDDYDWDADGDGYDTCTEGDDSELDFDCDENDEFVNPGMWGMPGTELLESCGPEDNVQAYVVVNNYDEDGDGILLYDHSNGTTTEVATGLSHTTDLCGFVSADGNATLYAVDYEDGSVSQLGNNGMTDVVTGLVNPVGCTVDSEANLYVTTFGDSDGTDRKVLVRTPEGYESELDASALGALSAVVSFQDEFPIVIDRDNSLLFQWTDEGWEEISSFAPASEDSEDFGTPNTALITAADTISVQNQEGGIVRMERNGTWSNSFMVSDLLDDDGNTLIMRGASMIGEHEWLIGSNNGLFTLDSEGTLTELGALSGMSVWGVFSISLQTADGYRDGTPGWMGGTTYSSDSE